MHRKTIGPLGLLAGLLPLACTSAPQPAPKQPQTPTRSSAPRPRTQKEARSATTPASTEPQSWATGRGFAVPIPEGYEWLREHGGTQRDAVVAKMEASGGVALFQRDLPDPSYFAGSIVVLPARDAAPEVVSNVETCRKNARQIASVLPLDVKEVGLVTISGADHCQWTLSSGDPARHQTTRGTVMRTPSAVWVVTCNYDSRDATALEACQTVLDGWRTTGS